MRYASRNDPQPSPLYVSIDALLAEARRVERERTLLEVRREISAIPVTTPSSRHAYGSDDRSVHDVAKDVIAAIDRKLAQ